MTAANAIGRVGIVGAGAWGTALAAAAHRAGRAALLWDRDAAAVADINERHVNPRYLPSATLDRAVRATTTLEDVSQSDMLLLVVPAQATRAVAKKLAPLIAPGMPVVLCAKGVELGSLRLMSEVLAETVPQALCAVLSGPSFASDVVHGLPTAVTLACADERVGQLLVEALGSRSFRPYWSGDVIGAQIGGAIKNVIAIACGIVVGRGLGESARAAIMTRGFAELTRLARAAGATAETLMGLSGLGDLALTCTSAHSRNYAYGQRIGAGAPVTVTATVEGVPTAAAVRELAERYRIEMPITVAVDEIANRGCTVNDAMDALLARPFKSELA